MYKRLDNGAFRWPRSADEALAITQEQYRMLMQGLEIVARYLGFTVYVRRRYDDNVICIPVSRLRIQCCS